jgi:aspartyl-tRNA synthetase
MLRTHTCGELTEGHIGQTVTLTGWAHRRRDHGGIVFIDLRDRYGLTQITFHPDVCTDFWNVVETLRSEWVLSVTGEVMARPNEMINEKLETGHIELSVKNLIVLNTSKTLPFEIDEDKPVEANENLRLQYRFIDLRRPQLQKLLALKDRYIRYMREYFHARNF